MTRDTTAERAADGAERFEDAQDRPLAVGVDGCRGGWMVAWRDASGHIHYRVLADFESVAAFAQDAIIAVDIPIGLLDDARPGGRRCDVLAREALGKGKSRVFSPPVRTALDHADDYAAANAANVGSSESGIGISKQSFAILPRIREVDDALARSETLARRTFEAHPEASFVTMNGGRPLHCSKKDGRGLLERLSLLEEHGFRLEIARASEGEGGFALDDLLDAAVACWTAERIRDGQASAMPAEAEVDARGREMRVWR